MRSTRLAGAAGLLAAVLAAAGCGGEKTGEVSGMVTVDGQPAPTGSSITFVPADGRPTAGAMIEDGRYSAKVAAGKAKVQVRVPKFASGKAAGPGPAGGPGAGPGPGPGGGDRVIGELTLVDASGQSEFTYDVKSGSQEKNWELKSKDK